MSDIDSLAPGRVAVLSDIHGNLCALDAVLTHAHAHSADEYLVLGDSLTRGPDPIGVIARLQDLGATCIRGNVEAYLLQYRRGLGPASWYGSPQWSALSWTSDQLRDPDVDWIASLPETMALAWPGTAPIRLVHGSPRDPAESLYVSGDAEVTALYHQAGLLEGDRRPTPVQCVLPLVSEPNLLCGHTHLPWMYREGTRLALNPGSVGMSVAGDPQARYALLSPRGDQWAAQLYAVPYDGSLLRQRFKESGALQAGGAMGQAFLATMLTGRNAIMAFVRHARRVRKEIVDTAQAWDMAQRTFPWQMYELLPGAPSEPSDAQR